MTRRATAAERAMGGGDGANPRVCSTNVDVVATTGTGGGGGDVRGACFFGACSTVCFFGFLASQPNVRPSASPPSFQWSRSRSQSQPAASPPQKPARRSGYRSA